MLEEAWQEFGPLPPVRPIFRATIPLPPSLNSAYPSNKTTGRRYASEALTIFKAEAIPLIRQARNEQEYDAPLNASYRLVLRLWFADQRSYNASDASNRIKAAEDALADALEFNDNHVQDVRSIKCGVDSDNPRCEIELEVSYR